MRGKDTFSKIRSHLDNTFILLKPCIKVKIHCEYVTPIHIITEVTSYVFEVYSKQIEVLPGLEIMTLCLVNSDCYKTAGEQPYKDSALIY